jgi:hypothetical protein
VVVDKMLAGATPTLDDTFNLDFRAVPYEGIHAEIAPVMEFCYGGKITRTTATKNADGDYIMPFRKILAHCVAEEITLTMFAMGKDGSMINENMTYSIKDYCERMLAREDLAPVVKELLSATLRYGAAAQTYASYKTDALATDGVENLTDAPAFDATSIAKIDKVLSGDYVSGAKWKSATLVLGSSMAIRYSFEADSVEGLKVVCSNGEVYTSFAQADGRYYFDVPVYANEFDSIFTVAFEGVDNYALSYSVNHYVATKYDANMIKTSALLEAIYNYGVAADAYAAATAQ